MEDAIAKYRHAIASYKLPRCEPIFSIEGIDSREQTATLFRPGGPIREHHRDIPEFWASALFNYLEDRLADNQFKESGERADYRVIGDDEARHLIAGLSFPEKYIAVPTDPHACAIAMYPPLLKALIGSDANGFFTIFWDS
jgi:hypothetical protein